MMADLVSVPAPLRARGVQPRQRLRIVVESDVDALERHIPAWESLAASAIAPNPFYEPWMLIPALRELADEPVSILLIYGTSGDRLCGLMPVVRRSSYHRMPIPNLRFWKHKYCFLCTPLLRAGFAESALAAYLGWAESNLTAWSLIEFNHTAGDGPFSKLLKAELQRRNHQRCLVETFERAMIRPAASGLSYLESNISNGRRKEWRRQFNRLQEQGCVEFTELDREEDTDRWIDHFMEVEASGWKGRAGSAILSDVRSQRFFSQVMHGAFQCGKLMMLSLCLNGVPIAMKCSIRGGKGVFAFKIAYREDFRRFSPGVQLELETIHRLHRNRDIQWMDSCAEPNHVMIDHLWAERRTIQTVTVPAPGRFAASIRSLMDLRNYSARVLGKMRTMGAYAS
jgi:CelD/BcsL family acetyltransferase involved in cellulose biosynthesis